MKLNSRRSRNGRRSPSVRNPNQAIDSNGPAGRIRGTAHQVYEKYASLARDAHSSGDRVAAERLHQHADHYFRLLNEGRETAVDNAQPDTNVQPETNAQPGTSVQADTNAQPPMDVPPPVREEPSKQKELPKKAEKKSEDKDVIKVVEMSVN